MTSPKDGGTAMTLDDDEAIASADGILQCLHALAQEAATLRLDCTTWAIEQALATIKVECGTTPARYAVLTDAASVH
jgi:hypothetical protein